MARGMIAAKGGKKILPPTRSAWLEGESASEKKKRTAKILRLLKKDYPRAKVALHYDSPLQLLIATILSAQCTDKRVNQLTPALFKRFEGIRDFAEADPVELEEMIRPAGFFRQKTKSIIGCCRRLLDEHAGQIPPDVETFSTLPGVGRKTANVVLGNAFGVPGIAVDTHVSRIVQRLGLTDQTDPVKIESVLMALLDPKDWAYFSNAVIHHGREICRAVKPDCPNCRLARYCPSAERF